MTRVFEDGAEFGDLLNIGPSVDVTASTDQPRSGSYSYKILENGILPIALTSGTEFYARIPFYIASGGYATSPEILFYNIAAVSSGGIRLDIGDGVVKIINGSGSVIAATSATWSYDTWTLAELRYKVDASTGAITYQQDEVFAGGFTGNTSGANLLSLRVSNGSGGVMYVDDIAINDTAGGTDDTWPGDGHFEYLTGNADGDASQWINSNGDSINNWSYIDEIPPDGDTSYVTSSTPGDQDLYNLTPFSGTGKQVLRAWVEGRGKDAGLGDVKPLLKSGATLDTGAAVALTASYDVFRGVDHTTNPDTGLAWTDSDLDSLQAGQENV